MITSKTPILGRTFLATLLLFVSSGAKAETLSEAQVIAIAHRWDMATLQAREARGLADAREVEADVRKNPTLAYNQEHFLGAASELENALSFSLPLDLSGKRDAGKALARSQASSARARESLAKSDAAQRALFAFYEVLAAKRRAAINRAAVERLEEAARVLSRRYEEGTVSGYEQSRIEIETELALSELRETEASAATLRNTLAARLGVQPEGLELVGSLETQQRAAAGQKAKTNDAPPRHASIDHQLKAAEHASQASDAAQPTWLPGVTLTGGLRMGVEGETRYGYLAGVAVELPFFSNGEGLRAEATATQRFATAQAQAAERALGVRQLRAEGELLQADAEQHQLTEATTARLERLALAAQSGYREGERSIVELLDAQRTQTQVQLRLLQLAYKAKRAEIALRAARGEFE